MQRTLFTLFHAPGTGANNCGVDIIFKLSLFKLEFCVISFNNKLFAFFSIIERGLNSAIALYWFSFSTNPILFFFF